MINWFFCIKINNMDLLNLAILFFLIGVVSDLVLQNMSGYYIRLLQPFWNAYGDLTAASLAGVTTLIGGLLIVYLMSVFFQNLVIGSMPYIINGVIISIIIGFALDLGINFSGIFPSLRLWYTTLGPYEAGFWGALALVFVFVSGIYLNSLLSNNVSGERSA